ncbi:methyl-accepting chemotaxis protein [Janthinobacterium fluminis]|uniref:Methyl-accepting chemotaxis protein n=1 Tax=Janthinobacterium fluminis TaxID=2987524 RepID=A0ABT5JV00_9BURK|nr:methyl-accepting chemotaxis protein [Janthinobacterium fluminis]MDC8756010.1 methyl-accepting chemotaxis protein [Janthinobacterium fluminis]
MNNLKIGARLGLGFAAVLLLLLALTAISIARMQSASEMTDELVKVKVRDERHVAEWVKLIEVNAARTSAAWKVSDAAAQQAFEAEMKQSSARATVLQDLLGETLQDPATKALYRDVLGARQGYADVRKAVFKAKAEGNMELGKQLFDGELIAKRDRYLGNMAQLAEAQKNALDRAADEIRQQYDSGRNLLLALGAAAVLLGLGCALWITRSITGPIRRAVLVAQAVSTGDLSTDIAAAGNDETGQLMKALKQMNGNLVDIVSQVRAGTEAIGTASGQIAVGNADLSARTEQQAGTLEETASSMEELTATVKLNADNARSANQLAIDASAIASKGGAVVADVVSTMGSINDSSRKIVDIISVIDAIAFQTNILALNAAVEAARAGEQGRGFAVVASEVRNLAQRSAAAAKEIKELIDDSVQKVEAGSQLVDKAGRTMDEIVTSIGHVTGIMNQITDASDEQRIGIEQVNQAIGQMDQATQQNAALVEEAAAAAESMQEQAVKLEEVVRLFKLDATRAPVQALKPTAARAPQPARAAPRAPASRRLAVNAGAEDWETF